MKLNLVKKKYIVFVLKSQLNKNGRFSMTIESVCVSRKYKVKSNKNCHAIKQQKHKVTIRIMRFVISNQL